MPDLKDLLGRQTVIRRLEDKYEQRVRSIRNRPSEELEERIPRVPNRNIGSGIAAGSVEAGIAVILEDVIGIPFGASSEVVDVEGVENGYLYTVNVNAPTQNMAQSRAFLESTTGFTALLTDLIDVRDTEVINTRTFRDTYQIEVRIED